MHISYTSTLEKFGRQGEKTGWTYLIVPEKLVQLLKPGNKKAFRVKGLLDQHNIAAVAIMPMGDGSFILAVNADMRKALKKRKGDTVKVKLEVDNSPLPMNPELLDCLKDSPEATEYFNSLAASHRYYFSKWIDSAKTESTKINRLAHCLNCLAKEMDYGKTIRSYKDAKIT